MAASNQIIHGDVLEVLRSLPGEPAFDVVIADPPYNHGIWRNEAPGDYAAWCKEWLDECLLRLRPDGLLYCYGWPEMLAHVAVRFPVKKQRWLQWCYRNRTSPTSQLWQRSHESILILWHKKPRLQIDQIREPYNLDTRRRVLPSRYSKVSKEFCLHPGGALPRDHIDCPVLGLHGGTNEDHKSGHPAQKPVRLTKWLLRAILPNDQPGDVLIPFAGSGSECLVAQSMGHNFLGIELDPKWVRLARTALQERQPML